MRSNLILLLAAMIWGAGFAAQHAAMEGMGPLAFTAIRFLLGWVVLQPIVRRRKPSISSASVSFKPVLILGLVLFAGSIFQQYGLLFTTASKAGFLTGLYVVFVPLLGLFLKHRLKRNTWIGTGLAALGLYFLSVTESFHFAPGDGLILIGAVIWAVHVLLLGNLAAKQDPVRLASQQFLIVGVIASVAALLFETQTPSTWLSVWPWVAYSGVFAVAVAFTLQAMGQAKASPAHCAILLSFEAVFAALAGMALLGESLSMREIGGGVLMFIGIIVSQLGGDTDSEPSDLAPEVHPPAS
ncbi:MAG: EamA family transporter [Planctomycetota bacterium]|nr:MAG: EamA family transporter [Planctomycetota bacterium]